MKSIWFGCLENSRFSSDKNDSKNGKNQSKKWYSLRNMLIKFRKPKITISDPVPLPENAQIPIKIPGVVQARSDHQVDANENIIQFDEITNDLPVVDSCAIDEENEEQKINDNDRNELDLKRDQVYRNDVEFISNEDLYDDCVQSDQDQNHLNYGWFWGDITRKEAETLLRGQEEGSFLVRSKSDQRFLFSLSFRSNDRTLHTRIEFDQGLFYFYSNSSSQKNEIDGSSSLAELISGAINQNNDENVFFYSRTHRNEVSLHSITLVKPFSRFKYLLDFPYQSDQSKALQYLCKFVIYHSELAQKILEFNSNKISEKLRTFLNQSDLIPNAI